MKIPEGHNWPWVKNDIVKAKNAEITNYGIMHIFNEVTSNKKINQGTT